MSRRTHAADNSPVDRKRQQLLLSALEDTSSLKEKLIRCGTMSLGTTGWTYRCKLPSCAYCLKQYSRGQVRQAREMLAGVDHPGGGFLTIVLGATDTFEGIEQALIKARRDLRRFVSRRRKADARWKSFAFMGWFEVDAVDTELLSVIGGRRSALLHELGVPTTDGTIWSPTIHGLVRCESLTIAEVQDAFSQMWAVQGQALLKPFSPKRPMDHNIQNLVSYCLKNSCENKIDGGRFTWPARRMADFYEWQNSWSQSFKRLKITIKQSEYASEHLCHSNITGERRMPLPEMIRNLPIIVELRRRWDFLPEAKHGLPVNLDDIDSRLRYRDARQWCADYCGARWRFSVTGSIRSPGCFSPALFEFECADDHRAFIRAEATNWR